MLYTVKFRKKNQWFWRTLRRVKGDMIATDLPGQPRVFIFENESRLEVPTADVEFWFSPERYLLIRQLEDKARTGQK